jgi:DNA-binding transcriptional LysR family regulator
MAWLSLERLALLNDLASRGTIAAVAEARGYTPSAVSQQLARLQRDVGVALVEPLGRRLRLTAAGELLVGRYHDLRELSERTEAELATIAGGTHGRVRVAMFQSAMLALGPALLSGLASSHPDVRAEIADQEPEESLPALVQGAVDVVVAQEYENVRRPLDHRWEREDLVDERVYVAVSAEHPLARAGATHVALSELRDASWAAGHPNTAFGRMLREAAAAAGFAARIPLRSNDQTVLQSLVASGHAIALVPALAVAARQAPPLHLLEVTDVVLRRSVFLATRRSSVGQPLVEAVKSQLHRVAERLG